MSTETDRLNELIGRSPGITTVALRDRLRHDGHSSITNADIRRLMATTMLPAGTPADPFQQWWPDRLADPVGSPRPNPILPGLYPWQAAALTAWRAAGQRGVIEAVTGAGKTVVGLTAAVEEFARRGQIVVLVPTRELASQWMRHLQAVLPKATIGMLGDQQHANLDQHDVVVAVVNSARQDNLYPRRPGGLLIADECHRYASTHNSAALNPRFERRLGLSATFARPDNLHHSILRPYLGPVCYRLGYQAATTQGVIAPFDLTLVTVDFDETERAGYDEATQQMAAARSILSRHGHVFDDTPEGFFAALALLARTDDETGNAARAYLRAMQTRRHLLDNAQQKLDVLTLLHPTMTNARRSIVFTQSIEAANRAAAVLRAEGHAATAIHSGLNSNERRQIMAALRNGTITTITAPQVLDEGIDVPEAQLAIVLGASRSRRQMIQRMGRVLRPKPFGLAAHYIIVTVKNTVEDPGNGAHHSFLDETIPVARTIKALHFGQSSTTPDEVNEQSRPDGYHLVSHPAQVASSPI